MILIFSGVFLGLIFYAPFLSLAGFILLVPLLLRVTDARATSYTAFVSGWVFGGAFLTTVFAWIFEAYGTRWAFTGAFDAVVASLPGIVLIIALLAVCFGVFTLCVHIAYRFIEGTKSIVLVGACTVLSAFVFSLLEYVRLHFFTLLTGGTSTSIPFFTVGFLGYLLSPFEGLRALAQYGEVYLLTFIVVLINGLFFCIMRYVSPKKRVSALLVCIFLVTIGAYMPSFFPAPGYNAALKVAGIGMSIPAGVSPEFKDASTRAVVRAHQEAVDAADVVVFPETFGASLVYTPYLEHTPALVSARMERNETETIYVAGVFSGTQGGYISQKKALVPYGEYLPDIMEKTAIFSSPSFIEQLRSHLQGVSDTHSDVRVYEVSGTSLGVLFCNEAWSPDLAFQVKKQGAHIMVIPASHATFKDPVGLELQQERMLQVRAAALGIPLIQVTNKGASYVIDGQGNVREKHPAGTVFITSVPFSTFVDSI